MPVSKSIKTVNLILAIVLLAGFCLQLYLIYFGYNVYNFLVPPGSDAIQHYNIIQKIAETGKYPANYPPGFHVIVIYLSNIFHQGTFHILTYWTPVLVVMPAISMFFLLKQLFDSKVSVITTLVFLLTSYYPVCGFIDGNYPDILAYGVFGILMFGFLIRYFKTNKAINLFFASVLLLAIALIHHFSFVNIVAILIIFSLFPLYSLVFERKNKLKFLSWEFAIGLIVFIVIFASLFVAMKYYGPLVVKFADGFIFNRSALSNSYLNTTLDFPEYLTVTGPVIWYFGLIGLFYLFISSFKAGPEARAKQLVVVWALYFFIMSRFGSSALPARFAREIAPALVVAIGFLFNYMINLNSLRFKGYKAIIGFGLLGFVLVTNSFLMVGPAKIPESFSNMIWFWPKDQDKIDFIVKLQDKSKNGVPTTYNIVYNPYANLYMPVKAPSNFIPLELTDAELLIAKENLDYPYDYVPLSAKKIARLVGYEKLIHDLRLKYSSARYIFIDVKPPANPDGKVYPRYSGYEIYTKVLNDIADSGNSIKKFSDNAKLYQMY